MANLEDKVTKDTKREEIGRDATKRPPDKAQHEARYREAQDHAEERRGEERDSEIAEQGTNEHVHNPSGRN